jgi:hypothetical protein
MPKLTEVKIMELKEDLEDLYMMREACPDSDLVSLKDICNKIDRLLMKLDRFENPFSKKKSSNLSTNKENWL